MRQSPPPPHIPPPKNIGMLHDCSVPPFPPQKLVWEKNLGVQKDTTTVMYCYMTASPPSPNPPPPLKKKN